MEVRNYIRSEKITESERGHYIITGGPGVGKTTLINEMSKLRLGAIPEAATDIILKERKNGINDPLKIENFTTKIVKLQIKRQKQASASEVSKVFYDRSPIDTLTYCLYYQEEPPKELCEAVEEILNEGLYNRRVFFIESLGICEQNEVRHETLEKALEIGKKIKKSYKDLGFEVVKIPKDTVEERINKIMNETS